MWYGFSGLSSLVSSAFEKLWELSDIWRWVHNSALFFHFLCTEKTQTRFKLKLELNPLTVVLILTLESVSSPPVYSSIIACLHFFTANFSSEASLTLTCERMKSISRPWGHFALSSHLNVPNVYSTLFWTWNRLLTETCIEHSHSQRGAWCDTNEMSGPFHHKVAWQREQGTVY